MNTPIQYTANRRCPGKRWMRLFLTFLWMTQEQRSFNVRHVYVLTKQLTYLERIYRADSCYYFFFQLVTVTVFKGRADKQFLCYDNGTALLRREDGTRGCTSSGITQEKAPFEAGAEVAKKRHIYNTLKKMLQLHCCNFNKKVQYCEITFLLSSTTVFEIKVKKYSMVFF